MNDHTDALTDADRADRDRLLAQAHAALGREIQAKTEAARALREIRDRRLYRETHGTFEAFVAAEFDRSESWAYQRVELADVADDLDAAGAEPLTAAYQAGLVVQLRHPDPEEQARLRAEAVRLARLAGALRGRRPTEADFGAACERVRDEAAEAAGGVPGGDVGPAGERAGERAAVRAHGGLVVALRAGPGVGPVLAGLPGLSVVPYDEALTWPAPPARVVDAVPFARAQLDDWTDLTWPVLARDPWSAAESWAAPDGPFAATFYPDRLSSPRSRAAREVTDRERVVLVAPGVDVLDQTVPDRVACAVIGAAGADPGRQYVVLTRNPGRVWAGWPPNILVAVEAAGTAGAVADAARELRAVPARRVLLVRDLAEPVDPADLAGVDVALLRGARTRQEGYDAFRSVLGADRVDAGLDVRARHSAYLPL